MTYSPHTPDGAPRCIVVRLGGQCSSEAYMLRVCREHFGRQRELLLAGKTLTFADPTANFNTGRPTVVER